MYWDQEKEILNSSQGKCPTTKEELTDDDLDVIYGDLQEYVGRIQERYGIERRGGKSG